jgi:predicted RNase H-like nuclease (RuvC/YqgF family)
MKYFITKNNISAKQNPSELEALNKALNLVNYSADVPNARSAINALVNYIVENENSEPDTKLKELNESLSERNTALKYEYNDLEARCKKFEDDLSEAIEEIQKLEQARTEREQNDNENGRIATELQLETENLQKSITEKLQRAVQLSKPAYALLQAVSEKINIDKALIMQDYIIKYNVKQYAQVFHPFPFKPREAAAIVKQAGEGETC